MHSQRVSALTLKLHTVNWMLLIILLACRHPNTCKQLRCERRQTGRFGNWDTDGTRTTIYRASSSKQGHASRAAVKQCACCAQYVWHKGQNQNKNSRKLLAEYRKGSATGVQESATDVFNVLIMRSENTDYSKDWLLSDMATLVD